LEFICFCDNKGCNKEMKPAVDKGTLIAYCTECGKQINNVSPFMRRQMASEGQILKAKDKRVAWAIKCIKCNKEGAPKIKDNKLCCFYCEEYFTHLTKPVEQMIKDYIKEKIKEDQLLVK